MHIPSLNSFAFGQVNIDSNQQLSASRFPTHAQIGFKLIYFYIQKTAKVCTSLGTQTLLYSTRILVASYFFYAQHKDLATLLWIAWAKVLYSQDRN